MKAAHSIVTFQERKLGRGLARKDNLDNGSVYDVAGFTRHGDIKLSNGFVVPKDYGGITNGYAVTAHSGQGKTVDVSLVALGSESLVAANRENFYVAVSRGREAVRLYTDDKAGTLAAIKHSAARVSASELMDMPANPVPKPGTMQRLFGTERIRPGLSGHARALDCTGKTTGKEGTEPWLIHWCGAPPSNNFLSKQRPNIELEVEGILGHGLDTRSRGRDSVMVDPRGFPQAGC